RHPGKRITAMTATERKPVAPLPTPDTLPYWDAAKRHSLLIGRCKACDKPHYYPRLLCPFCMGEARWEEASGRGHIYSFSIMRNAPIHYAIAYVTLEEGPTMMTNIVNCDFADIHVGQAVRVVYRDTDGEMPVPMFEPA